MAHLVETGLDRLLGSQRNLLRGKRVALLAHPASVDRGLKHAITGLREAGVEPCALWGPEHGILGEAQDMEPVPAASSPWGIPVFSLYGHSLDTLRPGDELLRGVDAVVVDLQDVGARYYTFVYTMALCMEACASAGIEVIVLDRPNPLGGIEIEGGAVDPAFRSFVGMYSLPNRHGMTIAELALYFHGEEGVGAKPTVIPMEGWRRGMYFDDTRLPWVFPSPNMPTIDTALVYPGMCLFEGTELSEGRGTTRPFELVGAPFVDPWRLADRLAELDLPGVDFRPCFFKPMFQKHAGERCGGLQIHVPARAAFRPYLTGVAILWALKREWPEALRWRERAYEFVSDRLAIDLLAGSAGLREQIEEGTPPHEIAAQWNDHQVSFARRRAPYLLYD